MVKPSFVPDLLSQSVNLGQSPPNFSRSLDNVLVSRILDAKIPADQAFRRTVQVDLFKKLSFSQFQWNHYRFFPNVAQARSKLLEYENFWSLNANQEYVNEFEQYNNRTDGVLQLPFSTIDDLENSISKMVGIPFSFESILKPNPNFIVDSLSLQILKLYNFLINSQILTKNQMLKLLFNVEYALNNESDKFSGVTKSYWFQKNGHKFTKIKIEFSRKWNDFTWLKKLYESGWISVGRMIAVFAHEIAHAISLFYALDDNSRHLLNSAKDIFENRQETFGIENGFVVDYALQTMLSLMQADYRDFVNANYLKFAKWTSVPSNLARYEDKNHRRLHDEWFAEGFAYYYLTPALERTKIWDFWHQLFTKFLPEKFNS